MKLIYLEALLVWVLYSGFSKYIFVRGSLNSTPLVSALLENFISGVVFGVLFLYLFSHEDFFSFAKNIEKKEIKKEKKWTHKLVHYGRVFSLFIIAICTGPMIAALAAKFLIPKLKTKYLLVGVFSGFSALVWITFGRGLISPLF